MSGSTNAIVPPRFILTWAKSRKKEPNPALPRPTLFGELNCLKRDAINSCSSSSFPSPAKEGTGTPAAIAWLVGRVNGGFMITRSAARCARMMVSVSSSLWAGRTFISAESSQLVCLKESLSSSSDPMPMWVPLPLSPFFVFWG